VPPPETALGSLVAYITDQGRRDFQPMNANYGLMPELETRARGKQKKQKKIDMAARALAAIDQFVAECASAESAALPPLQEAP
jgi:methylenetetrahydrofolate--tRNA-(uracil-5-)-methyltransferase